MTFANVPPPAPPTAAAPTRRRAVPRLVLVVALAAVLVGAAADGAAWVMSRGATAAHVRSGSPVPVATPIALASSSASGNLASNLQRDLYDVATTAGSVYTAAAHPATDGDHLRVDILSDNQAGLDQQSFFEDGDGDAAHTNRDASVSWVADNSVHYRIGVGSSDASGGGAYAFSLSQAALAPLQVGSDVTGALGPGHEYDFYAVTGDPGSEVGVTAESVSGDLELHLALRDLDGDYFDTAYDNGSGANLSVSLDGSSPLYLEVGGGWSTNADGIYEPITGQYKLTTAAETDYLTPGATLVGQISSPGEVDEFRFDGTAGASVSLVLQSPDLDGSMTLYDPSGYEYSYSDSSGFGGAEEIYETLPASGQYTVNVSCYGSDTGSYSISLQTN